MEEYRKNDLIYISIITELEIKGKLYYLAESDNIRFRVTSYEHLHVIFIDVFRFSFIKYIH